MKRSMLPLLALIIAVAIAPFTSFAKVGGEDITYSPKGVGKVVFRHELHVSQKGQKCTDCHYKTFQMRGGDSAYKMDMATLTKGQFCGSCHNGKKAFDVKESANCNRCHKD
ncbi:MAG: cytochrome c3 family protein [Nitrospiraceae bacterium]|nr:cytochrome c3 family protein [Nitrospiraceae bacterium]